MIPRTSCASAELSVALRAAAAPAHVSLLFALTLRCLPPAQLPGRRHSVRAVTVVPEQTLRAVHFVAYGEPDEIPYLLSDQGAHAADICSDNGADTSDGGADRSADRLAHATNYGAIGGANRDGAHGY